ncbi:MAG: 50S ribosomal protein L23 [Candidatus Daviesbacteria bacterium]|nr:MAG: 50S ribosomal protein L23 [Candidatus Daviesbacteria bacterium]
MIILQKPKVTEKSMKLADKRLYTFEVAKNATKKAIAKIVADKFKVTVLSVKTVNIPGQKKMERSKRKYYRLPDIKKAMVLVRKGQKIALFETPQEEVAVTTAENEPQVLREKKGFLNRGTKVRVEKSATGASPTTQRKVIPT